ncbi:MAG TPA: hypothetical protein VG604_04765 [Candidatus Saccharimonadales bacterium]|nr:hypothetical protein [Candidatus Saccharimonadales bacterium]
MEKENSQSEADRLRRQQTAAGVGSPAVSGWEGTHPSVLYGGVHMYREPRFGTVDGTSSLGHFSRAAQEPGQPDPTFLHGAHD